MTEKVENNAVISDVSGAATAVPESSEIDNAVCTDIAARDEFVPWEERKFSEARAFGENLGSYLGTLVQEIQALRGEVKALRVGQENMTAAGKTVDDVYVRMIEVEGKVEELFDSTISTNEYDPEEWVRESDIGDRVRELRFNVEVE